jgi:hypothetical protein
MKPLINECNAGVVSAWVDIIGILISLIFGFWISSNLQKKITSKRVLKDHLINEVKTLNDFYFNFINDLMEDKKKVKGMIALFKSMNIKIKKIMEIIQDNYKISNLYLTTYQISLRNIILNCKEYEFAFKNGGYLELSNETINELLKFRQQNEHLFNELILLINNTED